MAKGGRREGSGRKRGVRNKLTRERQQAMEEMAVIIEDVIPNAFDGDAHALLMAVYKNQDLPLETRIDAAKAAIRFEKPVLGSIEHSGKDGGPIELVLKLLGEIDGKSRSIPVAEKDPE